MLPFALELTDDLDPTALATVALAIVTVISVVVGWLALNKAQSEVDLSRREVEEAHRPVVVPIIDDTPVVTPGGVRIRQVEPRFLGEGRMLVPVKNIGSGPALDVELGVILRNDAGEYSAAAGPERTGVVTGLGVSDLMNVDVRFPRLAGLPTFDVSIVYSDVAGKQWVTSGKFRKGDGGGRYTVMSIDEGTAPTKEQKAA